MIKKINKREMLENFHVIIYNNRLIKVSHTEHRYRQEEIIMLKCFKGIDGKERRTVWSWYTVWNCRT